MSESAISCAAADPRGLAYRPSPASPTDSGQPASAWFKSSLIVVLQLKVATDPGVDALQGISFDEMDSSHFTSAKISRWYWMKRERHS